MFQSEEKLLGRYLARRFNLRWDDAPTPRWAPARRLKAFFKRNAASFRVAFVMIAGAPIVVLQWAEVVELAIRAYGYFAVQTGAGVGFHPWS